MCFYIFSGAGATNLNDESSSIAPSSSTASSTSQPPTSSIQTRVSSSTSQQSVSTLSIDSTTESNDINVSLSSQSSQTNSSLRTQISRDTTQPDNGDRGSSSSSDGPAEGNKKQDQTFPTHPEVSESTVRPSYETSTQHDLSTSTMIEPPILHVEEDPIDLGYFTRAPHITVPSNTGATLLHSLDDVTLSSRPDVTQPDRDTHSDIQDSSSLVSSEKTVLTHRYTTSPTKNVSVSSTTVTDENLTTYSHGQPRTPDSTVDASPFRETTTTQGQAMKTTYSDVATTVYVGATTVSEVKPTVSNVATTVSDESKSVSHVEITVTDVKTTASNVTTKPIPDVNTTVSDMATAVHNVETTVSNSKSTLSDVKSTVPAVKSTVFDTDTTNSDIELTVPDVTTFHGVKTATIEKSTASAPDVATTVSESVVDTTQLMFSDANTIKIKASTTIPELTTKVERGTTAKEPSTMPSVAITTSDALISIPSKISSMQTHIPTAVPDIETTVSAMVTTESDMKTTVADVIQNTTVSHLPTVPGTFAVTELTTTPIGITSGSRMTSSVSYVPTTVPEVTVTVSDPKSSVLSVQPTRIEKSITDGHVTATNVSGLQTTSPQSEIETTQPMFVDSNTTHMKLSTALPELVTTSREQSTTTTVPDTSSPDVTRTDKWISTTIPVVLNTLSIVKENDKATIPYSESSTSSQSRARTTDTDTSKFPDVSTEAEQNSAMTDAISKGVESISSTPRLSTTVSEPVSTRREYVTTLPEIASTGTKDYVPVIDITTTRLYGPTTTGHDIAVSAQSSIPGQDVVQLSGKFKITNIQWNKDLADKESQTYKDMANQLKPKVFTVTHKLLYMLDKYE